MLYSFLFIWLDDYDRRAINVNFNHEIGNNVSQNSLKSCYKLTFLSYFQYDLGCFSCLLFNSGLGAGSGGVTNKVIQILIGYGENQPTQLSKNTNLTYKKDIQLSEKFTQVMSKTAFFSMSNMIWVVSPSSFCIMSLGTSLGGEK